MYLPSVSSWGRGSKTKEEEDLILKIEGKKKGFESTETKNEVPHIVE